MAGIVLARRLQELSRRPRGAGALCRLFASASENQQAWEAKASKESKGQDPYTAFASTTIDVR